MKRLLWPIVLCLLIGTVANAALSCWLLTQWPSPRMGISGAPRSGAELGSADWPIKPPLAWPRPDYWAEWRSFGLRWIDARQSEGTQGRFSMHVLLSGWPLPTLYGSQMWWPWDDPQWKSSAQPEFPCRPLAGGWIGNSLIFAFAAWLLLFAAPYTIRSYILAARRARKLCPHCRYPIGTSPVCTECGRPVSASPPGAKPSLPPTTQPS